MAGPRANGLSHHHGLAGIHPHHLLITHSVLDTFHDMRGINAAPLSLLYPQKTPPTHVANFLAQLPRVPHFLVFLNAFKKLRYEPTSNGGWLGLFVYL